MEKIRIHRGNMKDLVFTGEEIASASNKWINGQDQSRWEDLTLYRTTGGKYVLQREYCTQWQGESGSDDAEIFDNVAELNEHFRAGISNIEYELIQEGKKTCPELDEILVDELE